LASISSKISQFKFVTLWNPSASDGVWDIFVDCTPKVPGSRQHYPCCCYFMNLFLGWQDLEIEKDKQN
jgi:hypothetical protein